MLSYFETVNEDAKSGSDLAARSLLNTPSFTEIFRGSSEERLPMMKILFYKNIKMNAARNPEVLHLFYNDKKELECFFMLVPNAFQTFSFCEMIGGGLLELPFYCGFDSVSRMVARSDYYGKMEAEMMKDYPVWYYLQRMVVDPKLQGKGIGSKCLGKVLGDIEKMDVPVLLSTQEMRNVTFYGRLGFKQIHAQEFVADDPKYSYMSYWMIRIPEPKGNSK